MHRRVVLLFCAVLALLSFEISCSEIRQPTLTASASTTELGPGKSAQITVTRQYPGGGPIQTVTNEVRYVAFPHDIINVSESGLVTPGPDPGTADVRVSDLDDTATATIRFTVTSARVLSLRVDPTPLVVLQPGAARQFGVIAMMSDGTESNLTNSVQWQSSNESAATVGRTQGDVGNVVGIAAGETTITATDIASNQQARTVVLVQGDPPTLAAITLTPNPATATIGTPLPLTAIGVYTSGKTEDVTHTSEWSTTDPTKATVDGNGIVTGLAAGTVTITAAGNVGLIKGSTALTIQ